jgi:hypothetical protein
LRQRLKVVTLPEGVRMPRAEEAYVSDWLIERTHTVLEEEGPGASSRGLLPSAPTAEEPSLPPNGSARGEHDIMADGQLGGALLASGPELSNPEGSGDISNGQYRERAPKYR